MYERNQVKTMLDRIHEPRRTIMVISGPRQCGKTTAVNQMLEKCGIRHFDFSADNVNSGGNNWIIERWESVRNIMDAENIGEAIMMIDEIQKISNWSEAVKSEWDFDSKTGRNLKIVLLGSSRLLLQKGLEESLAGRYEKIDMTFWSYDEMRDAFGMTRDEYIYFGGFPGLHYYISDERRWRGFMESSIVVPFLQCDLAQIEEIRNPALMSRVFALGSAMSGREVSVSKLQTELNSGSNPTVASYLGLLDKTMMLKPVFKYRPSALDKNNSVPKMQVYNNGFLSVNHNLTFKEVRSDNAAWGQWLESAVGAYLLNMSAVNGFEVFYWRETKAYKDKEGRTRNGTFEVDFVLRKGLSVVAIEVKSNRAKNLNGIAEFRKLFTEDGGEKLTSALVVGNQGLTFEEFCRIELDRLFSPGGIAVQKEAAVPLSRLDKGQKDDLDLIGRVNGTVWIDGDEYLVQNDSEGILRKMLSKEVYRNLENNPPGILVSLNIAVPSVLNDLAKGHTIAVGELRLFYDIESGTIKNGISPAEARANRRPRTEEYDDLLKSKPMDKGMSL